MKSLDCLATTAVAPLRQAFELIAQLVEEKRLDNFENVLFGCVVRPLCSALLRVHDGLEK